jgi:hypothetical protein
MFDVQLLLPLAVIDMFLFPVAPYKVFVTPHAIDEKH